MTPSLLAPRNLGEGVRRPTTLPALPIISGYHDPRMQRMSLLFLLTVACSSFGLHGSRMGEPSSVPAPAQASPGRGSPGSAGSKRSTGEIMKVTSRPRNPYIRPFPFLRCDAKKSLAAEGIGGHASGKVVRFASDRGPCLPSQLGEVRLEPPDVGSSHGVLTVRKLTECNL